MSVVLNEIKQAERVIEKGEIGIKPTATLFLISKYYRMYKNMSTVDTINKIDKFMNDNYKNYNSAQWEHIIESIVKKSNKYQLRVLDFIGVTQYELEQISTLNNIKHKKLLFTMLCFAKLYNTVSIENNSWINTDINELYRVSRVYVKYKKDKFLILNDLESAGLIAFSKKNDNLNIRITFTDMNGDSLINITDFRELGYEYLNYIGTDKFIKCSECGRMVRKTNNKCMYCNDCAKIINRELTMERMRNIRKL